MQKFEVYRNIRKKAMIFGLSVPFFALQMTCIIASLMVIIFSFNLFVIILASTFNSVVYVILTRVSQNPLHIIVKSIFPKIISNKKSTMLDYEKD